MKKTILFAPLLIGCLSLHISNHEKSQKQHKTNLLHKNVGFSHNKYQSKHSEECQFCIGCQPIIGGGQRCTKCLYGQKIDGLCPTNSTIANCVFDQDGQCSWCRRGFHLNNTTKTCQPCQSSNCSSCDYDKKTCDYCKSGFQLTQEGQCKPCDQKCLYCPSGQCYGCVNGYVLNSENVCVTCGIQNCQGCSQPGNCGWCTPGYELIDNQCVQCPENCDYCQNGECYFCKVGYILLENKQCMECDIYGCNSCDEPNHCTSCFYGNVSSDGSICEETKSQVEQIQKHKRK